MCDGSCDDGVCDCVSDDKCVMLGVMLCVMFLCNVLYDVACDGVGM